MCRYRYVFFDLDGTLADTDLLVIECFYQLFQHYYPSKKVPFRLLTSFSGPSLKDTLTTHFSSFDLETLMKEYQSISLPRYDIFATLYPGIPELLLDLKSKGVKLAIITSKMKNATDKTIAILDLKNIFDYIVTLDDVTKPKPDAEGINKALAYFSSSKAETLYVGDAYSDLLAAQSAGIDCALVSWNIRGRLNINSTYYVSTPDELKEVILHGKE